MPRKFNVGITGCRENCTHSETQDIALVAGDEGLRRPDEVKGFNVLVGGKNGSGGHRVASPLDVFVRPEQAAVVCSAIVLVFRDHGARDARNKIPARRSCSRRGARRSSERPWRRGSAGDLRRRARTSGSPGGPTTSGSFGQKQPGLNYVASLVPVGRITGAQLLELARLSERYGTGEVRLTVDQNVIIPNVARPPVPGAADRRAAAPDAPLRPARRAAGAGELHRHRVLQPGARSRPRAAPSGCPRRSKRKVPADQAGADALVGLPGGLRQPHAGGHRPARHPDEGRRQGGRRGRHLHGRRVGAQASQGIRCSRACPAMTCRRVLEGLVR